jgi:hypothetical protein
MLREWSDDPAWFGDWPGEKKARKAQKAKTKKAGKKWPFAFRTSKCWFRECP